VQAGIEPLPDEAAARRLKDADVDLRKLLAREARARKYSPDQPRVAAGNPDGGQWTDGSAGGGDAVGDSSEGGGQSVAQNNPGLQDLKTSQLFLLEEPPVTIRPPLPEFPTDPTQPPGPGWEWMGKGPPGSPEGNWYNPETDESLHPDFSHGEPIGPHYDYYPKLPGVNGKPKYRWFPDGRVELVA
jgi:hypothetical protein